MGYDMKTKVNINIEILAQIIVGSEKLNVSRTALIKRLMKCFEGEYRKYITINTNVRYQEKDLPESWKQFHLYLTEPEYECFINMRNFCKMSLSYIIAFSVEKYLDGLLHPEIDPKHKVQNMDNYPDILFPGYGILWKKTNSGYRFTIYWGYPDKIPEDFG